MRNPKPYDEVIKISPTDSLLAVPQIVKDQLQPIINQQTQTGQSMGGTHLLLTQANKTLATNTSRWLAAQMQKNIYRVNLSALTSKYIGETEKNLDRIFSTAEENQAILFFDEAEELFGKRTDIKDAHDKYANETINYLLQKIEHFRGVVLLPCILNNCLRSNEQIKFEKISTK